MIGPVKPDITPAKDYHCHNHTSLPNCYSNLRVGLIIVIKETSEIHTT